MILSSFLSLACLPSPSFGALSITNHLSELQVALPSVQELEWAYAGNVEPLETRNPLSMSNFLTTLALVGKVKYPVSFGEVLSVDGIRKSLKKGVQIYEMEHSGEGEEPFVSTFNDLKALVDNVKDDAEESSLGFRVSIFPGKGSKVFLHGFIHGDILQLNAVRFVDLPTELVSLMTSMLNRVVFTPLIAYAGIKKVLIHLSEGKGRILENKLERALFLISSAVESVRGGELMGLSTVFGEESQELHSLGALDEAGVINVDLWSVAASYALESWINAPLHPNSDRGRSVDIVLHLRPSSFGREPSTDIGEGSLPPISSLGSISNLPGAAASPSGEWASMSVQEDPSYPWSMSAQVWMPAIQEPLVAYGDQERWEEVEVEVCDNRQPAEVEWINGQAILPTAHLLANSFGYISATVVRNSEKNVSPSKLASFKSTSMVSLRYLSSLGLKVLSGQPDEIATQLNDMIPYWPPLVVDEPSLSPTLAAAMAAPAGTEETFGARLISVLLEGNKYFPGLPNPFDFSLKITRSPESYPSNWLESESADLTEATFDCRGFTQDGVIHVNFVNFPSLPTPKSDDFVDTRQHFARLIGTNVGYVGALASLRAISFVLSEKQLGFSLLKDVHHALNHIAARLNLFLWTLTPVLVVREEATGMILGAVEVERGRWMYKLYLDGLKRFVLEAWMVAEKVEGLGRTVRVSLEASRSTEKRMRKVEK